MRLPYLTAGGIIAFALLFLCAVDLTSQEDKSARQKRIEEEIKRLRSEITELKASEKTTAQRVESLRLEQALHLREAERLGLEIEATETRIADLQAKEKEINESLVPRRAELGRILRRLYTSGKLSNRMLRLLLSMPDSEDVGLAYTYLSSLAEREQDFITGYLADLAALEEKRQELSQRKTELRELQVKERQASEEALQAEQEHSRLLAQIRSRLDNLMERLSKTEAGSPDIGFGAGKGRLIWPCRGDIVARFGLNYDRDYTVAFECDGIEIKARAGTPVLAVFDGKVVFADWIDERGNMVVLDHGRGYYTLYAHLAGFDVKLGGEVIEGQKIGSVGETGSIKGPILHFEIREFAKPQNPESWLKRY